jgi:hypothetical protein
MFNLEEYDPVDERLVKWWAVHTEGKIETELVHHDATQYVFKASGYRNDGTLVATGWAREVVTERGVNLNFALENAETSAIGRMLANAGFAAKIGKRPSREEMTKVQRIAASEPVPNDVWTINDAIGTVSSTLGAVEQEVKPSCKHGERQFLTGVSPKTNKPYKGYMCPEKIKAQQCAPEWIN